MYLHLKSWLKGLAMSLAGKPLAYDIKYLYNGIVLPQLPDWDKEEMPYAMIYTKKGEEGFYNLVTSATKIIRISSGFQSGEGKVCLWYRDDVRWNLTMTSSESYTISLDEETYDVIWTNTDILETAGTLYLAASDPVPAVIRGYRYGTEYVAPIPPDYDSTLYPYAFVTNYNGVVLYHYSSRPFHGTDGIQPREDCVKGTFRIVDGKWTAAEVPTSYDAYTITAYNPIWANYSIFEDFTGYYLYNGIQLPPLPEWDTETYPYAYVINTSTGYVLYAMDVAVTQEGDDFTTGGEVNLLKWEIVAGSWAQEVDGHNYNYSDLTWSVGMHIWSNVDINEDYPSSDPVAEGGNVLLAETKLVPVYYGQSAPTAYLYNGVRLPKLPDKISDFSCAFICFDNRTSEYVLMLGLEAPLYENRNDGYAEINYYGQSYLAYRIQKDASAWVLSHDGTDHVGVVGFALKPDRYDFIWTSHDIKYYTDVMLPGSEPVPVYE